MHKKGANMLKNLAIAAILGPIISYLGFTAYKNLWTAAQYVLAGYPGWVFPGAFLAGSVLAFAYILHELES
jgi:hypothetical protein